MSFDFRSDSTSLPTEEMLDAMKNAKDVTWAVESDPNVNALLEKAIEITGKEAAIFVPTVTMGNLVTAMTHAEEKRWGSEVILSTQAHNYWYEVAGIAKIAGLSIRNVDTKRGHITPEQLKSAIRPYNEASGPITNMLWLENPSMLGGGTVNSIEDMKKVYKIAKEGNIHVHMDGARLFNAAQALNVEPKEVARWTDTLVFSLSKALSCTNGSLLCGTSDFIERAKRNRKMLGGRVTKSGVLAASGVYALNNMIDRIADDHKNARDLAEGISRLMPGSVDLTEVQTNLVRVRPDAIGMTAKEFAQRLEKKGVRIITLPGDIARFATTRHIDESDIEGTLEIIERVVNEYNSLKSLNIL